MMDQMGLVFRVDDRSHNHSSELIRIQITIIHHNERIGFICKLLSNDSNRPYLLGIGGLSQLKPNIL